VGSCCRGHGGHWNASISHGMLFTEMNNITRGTATGVLTMTSHRCYDLKVGSAASHGSSIAGVKSEDA